MSQALTLSNVSYSVAGLDILRQRSLDVSVQQYYAIAGVNGAGKSTLIKLVLDLIRPQTGGKIRVFDLDNSDPQCRKKLAYLPEKFDVKKNIMNVTMHISHILKSVATIAANRPKEASFNDDIRISRINDNS